MDIGNLQQQTLKSSKSLFGLSGYKNASLSHIVWLKLLNRLFVEEPLPECNRGRSCVLWTTEIIRSLKGGRQNIIFREATYSSNRMPRSCMKEVHLNGNTLSCGKSELSSLAAAAAVLGMLSGRHNAILDAAAGRKSPKPSRTPSAGAGTGPGRGRRCRWNHGSPTQLPVPAAVCSLRGKPISFNWFTDLDKDLFRRHRSTEHLTAGNQDVYIFYKNSNHLLVL